MNRRVAVATAAGVLGVVAAVMLTVGITVQHDPPAAPLPPKREDRPIPPVSLEPPTTSSASTPVTPVHPSVPRSAATSSSSAQTPAPPAHLAADSINIPALGITATIGTASLSHGVLTPPRVPTEVGRWPYAARLGSSTGEVTLAGHINWMGMAPFAFGRLADLQVGSVIYTTDSHDALQEWTVVSVLSRPKSEPVDNAAFMGPGGRRELALITCGGAYDPYDHNYLSNVYVFALPA